MNPAVPRRSGNVLWTKKPHPTFHLQKGWVDNGWIFISGWTVPQDWSLGCLWRFPLRHSATWSRRLLHCEPTYTILTSNVFISVLICFNSPFGSCEAGLKSDWMKPVWGSEREHTYLSHTVSFILTPTALHPWDSLPEVFFLCLAALFMMFALTFRTIPQ